jgi:hypothetical protein
MKITNFQINNINLFPFGWEVLIDEFDIFDDFSIDMHSIYPKGEYF